MPQTLGTGYYGDSPVDFTPKGSWNATASPSNRAISPRPYGITSTTTAKSETTATNPWRVLCQMLPSDPLTAEASYSGTFDFILGLLESDAAADFYTSLHIWVSIGDTDVVRTTLLSNYSEDTTNEWPTTAAGLALQSAQAISGTWQLGDRVVVELGFVSRNSVTTSRTGTIRVLSDPAVGDLTVGSTSVTILNPTFTFNPALTLAAPANDLIDDATEITDYPYTVTLPQQYATGRSGNGASQRDPFVGMGLTTALSHSLWWTFTADRTATLHIDIDGSVGAGLRVSVFENLSAATIKTSAADDADMASAVDPSAETPLDVAVVEGSTYYVMVGYDFGEPEWGTAFGALTFSAYFDEEPGVELGVIGELVWIEWPRRLP